MIEKLALVIESLGMGGAEKVVALLSGQWAGEGREVTVVTLGGEEDFFTLAPAVRRVRLAVPAHAAGALGALQGNLGRIRALRRTLAVIKPQAVASFLDATNVLTILASRGLGFPVLVSEQTDPNAHRLNRSWETLRRLSYPLADMVAGLNRGAEEYFRARGVKRVAVVPNPIEVMPPADPEAPREKLVATLCRLEPVKGLDILVRAFARTRELFPDWRLEIWGKGSQGPALEELISDLGQEERIVLPGPTQRPGEVLSRASVYVLSSHYEGFAISLFEAMAAGLPVVSTHCYAGLEDFMTDGVEGFLVPLGREEPLSRALAKLMEDGGLRWRMAERGRQTGLEFRAERIAALWMEQMERAAARRGVTRP